MLKDRLALTLAQPTKAGKKKSQAGLARACGISAPSVNDWCSGKTNSIDGQYLTKAAAYLECSAHWLGCGEGDMAPLPQDLYPLWTLGDTSTRGLKMAKLFDMLSSPSIKEKAYAKVMDVLTEFLGNDDAKR